MIACLAWLQEHAWHGLTANLMACLPHNCIECRTSSLGIDWPTGWVQCIDRKCVQLKNLSAVLQPCKLCQKPKWLALLTTLLQEQTRYSKARSQYWCCSIYTCVCLTCLCMHRGAVVGNNYAPCKVCSRFCFGCWSPVRYALYLSCFVTTRHNMVTSRLTTG